MMSSMARPSGGRELSASRPCFNISGTNRSRICLRSSSVSRLRPSASLIRCSSPEAERTLRITANSSLVSRRFVPSSVIRPSVPRSSVAGEPGRVSLVTKATSVRAIYPQTEASDDPSRPDSVDYAADKDGRLRSLPKDLGGRGKIRDVAIASRCLAALLGIVVTACGPVDVAPHVDWEGRTYIPGSICLDRFDVTDRAIVRVCILGARIRPRASGCWHPGRTSHRGRRRGVGAGAGAMGG